MSAPRTTLPASILLIGVLVHALAVASGEEADAGRDFWAFQPVAEPSVPAVKDAAWPRSPLDSFILAALEAKGLAPAPAADRHALIRRATFDLTGLPPTPGEIEAFVADDSADAFARVVSRLLGSPRYGERWGRHWLDVARYADSNGLDENVAHGNAWRYRDYVVRSLNSDTSYDRFLIEQLAGDLLPSVADEDGKRELLIATGFLSLGPKVLAEGDQKKMEMDIIDEQIDTVGRALMGLTLGCARCHDHKYDPIPTEDYYALAGIFKSTKTMESLKRIARWHEHSLATSGDLERKAAHDKRVAEKKERIKRLVKEANERLKANAEPGFKLPKNPESLYPSATRSELARLRKEVTELEQSAPEMPSAMGVAAGEPSNVRVHIRGSHLTLGEEARRGFPAVLTGGNQPRLGAGASGRLELARWLAGPNHPLTARVMANRFWRWHFGQGLVRTPDNFGRRGERPANQPLLDWLAKQFVASGWSVKAMHRLVMLSSTYRMSNAHDPLAARVDPENRLHWRMRPRRLEAETIRDALLAVSGTLDLAMGGRSLLHVKNREFLFNHTSRDGTTYKSRRRSIYLPVVRNHVYDLFQLFDFPDPAVVSGDRATSTVAPQALFLMNSDLVSEACESMAKRLLAERGADDAERIRLLYLRAYGRPPAEEETARGVSFVDRFERALEMNDSEAGHGRLRAWQAFCQVVVASNEFVYLE